MRGPSWFLSRFCRPGRSIWPPRRCVTEPSRRCRSVPPQWPASASREDARNGREMPGCDLTKSTDRQPKRFVIMTPCLDPVPASRHGGFGPIDTLAGLYRANQNLSGSRWSGRNRSGRNRPGWHWSGSHRPGRTGRRCGSVTDRTAQNCGWVASVRVACDRVSLSETTPCGEHPPGG
jgi:hypothetical protein